MFRVVTSIHYITLNENVLINCGTRCDDSITKTSRIDECDRPEMQYRVYFAHRTTERSDQKHSFSFLFSFIIFSMLVLS